MTIYVRRAAVLLISALLLPIVAHAGPINATAELTNGSVGTINLPFSVSTSPASIDESITVNGNNLGTDLGVVKVSGNSSGDFELGVRGQATHRHEATFSFSELVTNTTSIAQQISLNFLIKAGELMVNAFELPPNALEFLEAGYEITMRFAGNVAYESGMILQQVRDTATQSIGDPTPSGTSLTGGVLTLANRQSTYTWQDTNSNAVLGILNPGATGLFEYDVRAFVRSTMLCYGPTTTCGSTLARIGDPFSFGNSPGSSIGNPNSFVFTPASPTPAGLPGPTAVPEPGTLMLFLLGLGALIRLRR